MSAPSPYHETRCATCGAALRGHFCSKCGEESPEHEPTVRHLIEHTVVHEFLHLDGKIFRTLRALVLHPGLLSEEYCKGRRKPYVNPVRLLITAAILFALLTPGNSGLNLVIGKLRLSLLPPGPPAGKNIEDSIRKLDVLGILEHEWERRKPGIVGKTGGEESEALVEKFQSTMERYGEALSFGNVLLMAGLLSLLFRKQRKFFVEHLIFSAHLAAFLLLLGTVVLQANRLTPFIQESQLATAKVVFAFLFFGMTAVQIGYFFEATKRFYRPATWHITLATVVIFFANSVFLDLVYGVGAWVSLMRL